MRIVSVTHVKTHLSAILSKVEMGQVVHIFRRGCVIARLVPEPKSVANTPFDFVGLATFVDGQAATDGSSVMAMRALSPAWCVEGRSHPKLGSRIAARFADVGLTEPLPELHGQPDQCMKKARA